LSGILLREIMNVGDKIVIFNSESERVGIAVTSLNIGDKVVITPALGGKRIALQSGVSGSGIWTFIRNLGTEDYVTALENIGNGIVLAGTMRNAEIWRSTDYGLTWTYTGYCYGDYHPPVTYSDVRFQGFANLGSGVIMGGHAAGMARSTDYGLTWTPVTGASGYVVADPALHYAYAMAGGSLYRSTNNGASFSLAQSVYPIYATEYQSPMWRNDNYIFVGMFQLYTSTTAQVWRSSDDGASYQLMQNLGEYRIWSFCDTAAGDLLLCTASYSGGSVGKVWRSQNSGSTWALIATPGFRIYDMLRVGSRIHAVSEDGYPYTSDDSGFTWVRDGTTALNSPAFLTYAPPLIAGTYAQAGIWRRA